ncbi:hypothetical protein NHJ6243_009629 [Beauveria neobassiana]
MPSSPRHRPPSLTQAAVQDLMNNPPTKKHSNHRFSGRDWRDITVGELVCPEDVCWVELDDSVEYATKMLLKCPTNAVLVRDSQTSNSVTSTFDFSDLNTYLLLVVGLTKPEDHQVAFFNDIISKAQKNQRIPLQLLVRGRFSRGLHVGCSILPGRKEPKYVQDLRELGYQVDVRERKCIDNNGLNAPRVNFWSATGSRSVCRYVEDLVDETLQTRIAEAVMEHFQEQGTIVLATGDAKPAQYSDGFFRYVERALRMGWNVELVAWRGSLSSSWTNTNWTATWNDRFRIIELDSFICDLLQV